MIYNIWYCRTFQLIRVKTKSSTNSGSGSNLQKEHPTPCSENPRITTEYSFSKKWYNSLISVCECRPPCRLMRLQRAADESLFFATVCRIQDRNQILFFSSKLVRRNVNESVIVPNIIFNVENKIDLMLYNLSNMSREYKSYFFA